MLNCRQRGGVHSTSWKFSRHFAHFNGWKFLTKYDSSDPSFNRSKTFALTQVAVIRSYLLFTGFLT